MPCAQSGTHITFKHCVHQLRQETSIRNIHAHGVKAIVPIPLLTGDILN